MSSDMQWRWSDRFQAKMVTGFVMEMDPTLTPEKITEEITQQLRAQKVDIERSNNDLTIQTEHLRFLVVSCSDDKYPIEIQYLRPNWEQLSFANTTQWQKFAEEVKVVLPESTSYLWSDPHLAAVVVGYGIRANMFLMRMGLSTAIQCTLSEIEESIAELPLAPPWCTTAHRRKLSIHVDRIGFNHHPVLSVEVGAITGFVTAPLGYSCIMQAEYDTDPANEFTRQYVAKYRDTVLRNDVAIF